MATSIRPDEVTSVLRRELGGFEAETDVYEVGTVLQVGDGIARLYGLSNVQAGELIEFPESKVMGMVLNLEEDNVGAVLFGKVHEVKEGHEARRTRRIASIQVSEGMLGRVIDPLGEPMDGRGPITGETFEMPLERKAPNVLYREPVSEPLQTGIKAIDAMIPIGRGQRELVIGDRQTGKTAVLIDTIINQKETDVYCIYVAIVFKPLLPDYSDTPIIRVDAIARWCEGFLHGLVSGSPDDNLKEWLSSEPLREIIKDLLQITRATADEEADDETNESSYIELVEYLRVAAQLTYEELAEYRSPLSAREVLH